jgi:hypothetical protein
MQLRSTPIQLRGTSVQLWSTYSSFHLDKPQIREGAVRELPLRDGVPLRKWL